MSPTVSVIIPTYDRRDWLPLSIGSVQAQTFHDWELLVVDDHSTDDTRSLIEDYSRADSRIMYLHNDRARGPAGARNHGIDRARGQFVAFLDSDDEWSSCHLRDSLDHLLKYSDRIEAVTADAVRKNRRTGETYSQRTLDLSALQGNLLDGVFVLDRESLFDAMLQQAIIATQTLVLRRETLAQTRFAEDLEAGPEDRYFHLQLAYQKIGLGYIPKAHVTYWAHGDNVTCCGGLGSAEDVIRLFMAFEKALLRCLREFELTTAQRRTVLRRLARCYVWQIGYNGFLQRGDYRRARQYYLKGIRINPFNLRYWKTFFASIVRQGIGRLSGNSLHVASN